ncbi:DUF975 family protein [Ectobacillus polymachus]|uniref:DUF975 family protein n=1 Tax=Ectobacillus polymachus TaxID=1508806 RepID=UPI003A8A7E98
MTGELKKKALASLKGKWGFAVLSTFLYMIISVVGTYIVLGITVFLASLSQNTDAAGFVAGLWNIVYIIVDLFITGILVFGIYYIYLQLAQGKESKVSDLFRYFAGWKRMWQAFLTLFLLSLYTSLWSLLLIVPGIIKSFSYALTYFILIDHPEYSVNQAITESRHMMNGHKWELFVLFLSFIGWILLCIITFGLAELWITPYSSIAFAHFYEKRKAAYAG